MKVYESIEMAKARRHVLQVMRLRLIPNGALLSNQKSNMSQGPWTIELVVSGPRRDKTCGDARLRVPTRGR